MEGTPQTDSQLSGIDNDTQFNLKCKYCHKNLSSRQNLREHLYIHTGEKPYICSEVGCGESFRQGSLLSIHKKIHLEIQRGQKKNSAPTKRCTYPSLTQLINFTNANMDIVLDEIEKNEWKSKIGCENFELLGKLCIRSMNN